jgi:RimJ/RimL family protein N-acetyltransferase
MATDSQPRVELRALDGTRDEMDALQRVLESAPGYAQLVTGAPPGPADAQSTYAALPDGKSYDDKFVFGVFVDAAMVGCIDIIRGYPDASTAHVGLLLIGEPWQGCGYGSAAVAALERVAGAWDGCARLRLGVLRSNDGAHRLWRRRGFVATGDVKSYRYGPVSSEIVLYAKALQPS